ncbi:hypothetical protein Ciccas_004288 [Cichlidogyrus casuarinus]|uniref:Uncharacterized protein n=1 Tax=Cichlidogyrus casuarinus TaxID=1844966 RepID=A0ABD2QFD4_9PLAT
MRLQDLFERKDIQKTGLQKLIEKLEAAKDIYPLFETEILIRDLGKRKKPFEAFKPRLFRRSLFHLYQKLQMVNINYKVRLDTMKESALDVKAEYGEYNPTVEDMIAMFKNLWERYETSPQPDKDEFTRAQNWLVLFLIEQPNQLANDLLKDMYEKAALRMRTHQEQQKLDNQHEILVTY